MPGLNLASRPTGLSGAKPAFVSNTEIQQYDNSVAEAQAKANQPFITSLAAHLRTKWQEAYNAKIATNTSSGKSIEQEILDDYRQRDGEYPIDKLQQIRKQGGSEIFMEITSVKCRTAEAQIEEVVLPAGDRSWGAKPANDPDLTPDDEKAAQQALVQQIMAEVQQSGQVPPPEEINARLSMSLSEIKQRQKEMAEEIADQMVEEIEDQFNEGGYQTAMREAISDLVTTKAGIIKGPIARRRKRLAYVEGPEGWEARVKETVVLEYKRVSPLDLYPSPESSGPEDGSLFERHKLSREDLNAMIGVKGYDDEAIKRVLAIHYMKGTHDWLTVDQQRAEHEQREYSWGGRGEKIEALEYWGSVSGKLLKEWGRNSNGNGLDGLEDHRDYQVNAWLIGNEVIKAVLNHDPLGRRVYSIASYENIPGAFWGRGLSELIRDVQAICNATARALVNNMGIASGPQVQINDISRVPAGQDITTMYPWKIWQFEPDSAHATGYRTPIDFFQPNPLISELMAVFEFFSRLADDYSGIPAYTYGNERVSGAGRTASGLSMLLNQTSKGLKRVVSEIDRNLIVPIVQRQYDWNMMYHEDESLKGDLRIQARGSAALIEKEQQAARIMEFMQIITNEIDLQLVSLKGRAQMLREVAKTLGIPADSVVKKDHEIDQILEAQKQPSPEQLEMQLKQQEVETEAATAQVEAEHTKAKTEKARFDSLMTKIQAAMAAGGTQLAMAIDRGMKLHDGTSTEQANPRAVSGFAGSGRASGMGFNQAMAGA